MADEIIWKDISNELKFKNAKANPFGWSSEEIWHDGKQIGSLYCGAVHVDQTDYRFTEKAEMDGEQKVRRITFERGMTQLDWDGVEHLKAVNP